MQHAVKPFHSIMFSSAFAHFSTLPNRRTSQTLAPLACAASPPAAGTIATGENARRLSTWLAADWHNKDQAMESPQFWAHVRVCFRPLPWNFLDGYSFYTESAYDYNIGAPYKTSVVLVVNDGDGGFELVSHKLKDPMEFWMGAHEPSLLESLSRHDIVKMPDTCNTVYKWEKDKHSFFAYTRPGKACRIQRKNKDEPESYLDCKLLLSEGRYLAWDLGRHPDTDEVIWGNVSGAFVFSPVKKLDHLVPSEPASASAAL